ncbi:ribonuclease P protein component [Patescibacteria group bacterium AH-259-L07]|nr:ribonuclease P protein component [Patescibacteria group bacterium AH-259-L07]
MLKKKYRLTKNKDFTHVAKQGQVVYGEILSIKWIKNNLDYSRFGIAVSLKIDKRATRRNRIKRILRAIIREHIDQFISGFDYLILTTPKIKELTHKQIEQKFLHLAQKNHLLHKIHD